MQCPICKVDMKIGIAIDAGSSEKARGIAFVQHFITVESLKLIEVYKCPKCGYSDDGVDTTKLIGIIDNR